MSTLIASLGQSPFVITETLDHLRDDKNYNLTFDRLVIIIPGQLKLANRLKEYRFLENGKDFSALSSAPVNPQYPQEIVWSKDEGYLTQQKDIYTEVDANAFYKAVYGLTSGYCYSEDTYYAIAGGRKSMSALMVLAAQYLPVKGIFHILLKTPPEQIMEQAACDLREDDDTFLGRLLEIDESDTDDFHTAFHPGFQNTELVTIPFRQSFDPNVVNAIKAQMENKSEFKFSDMSRAIYNYLIDNSQLQPEQCSNRKINESPKRLDNTKCRLTDNEKKWTKEVVKNLMKEIPQICEIEHSIEGRGKDKDSSNNLHCYDRNFHKNTNTSRFETMFPVSINPPLRVRFHIITTATNEIQMDFLWRKIGEHCEKEYGIPTNPAPAVLISTLGESPGIVTSAVHYYEKLADQPITFDKVVVVTPDNADIRTNCLEILKRESLLSERLIDEKFDAYDVRNQNELESFLNKMEEVVSKYNNEGCRIYLNLAGGRKVMAGVLLLLAQLYPVEKAFHLSIRDEELDREIEEYGQWQKLNDVKSKNKEKFQRILYPEQVSALELPISPVLEKVSDIL